MHLLIAVMATITIAFSLLLWHVRPTARMNRTLANLGLARVPATRTKFKIARQREQTLQSDNCGTYVKFCAEPRVIVQFVEQSSSLRDGLVETFEDPHRHTHAYYFWPRWFRPNLIRKGRLYVVNGEAAYGKVFIDDEKNIVYIAISSPQIPLIDRLRGLVN